MGIIYRLLRLLGIGAAKKSAVDTVRKAAEAVSTVEQSVAAAKDSVQPALEKMTKAQIAAYAEQRGIVLDRKLKKADMIAAVIAEIK